MKRQILLLEGEFFVDAPDGTRKKLGTGKEISCKADINTKDHIELGDRRIHTEATTYKYTGNIKSYMGTSFFVELLTTFKETKEMPKFSCLGVMNDPSSSSGRRSVLVTGILIESVTLFAMADREDYAEEDIPFTAEDYDILDEFVSFEDEY